MTVSVVLSVFNGILHLKEQLDSLVNQSRAPDEIVVVDDNSQDSSLDIVREYKNTYKSIEWIIIQNSENKGWRYSFHLGIQSAKGDLVFPCDQDDIWLKDKILKMEGIMASREDINVLVSNYEAFYVDKKSRIGPRKNRGTITQIKFRKHFLEVPYPGCTFCIRKSFSNSVDSFWKETYPHDAFYFRYSIVSNSCYAWNEKTILWRKHPSSSYTLEAIKNRKHSNKYKILIYLSSFISQIRKSHLVASARYSKALLNIQRFIDYRISFYEKPSLHLFFSLFFRLSYYSSFREFLGDIYLNIRK